jgi:hypothetical protein
MRERCPLYPRKRTLFSLFEGLIGYRSNLSAYFARANDLGKFRGCNGRRCSPSRPNSICEDKNLGGRLMLKNICAIGAILLLSTTSTMAAVPKECAADVKAQCGGVQPGAGRIRACINSHLKDLTPTCQTIWSGLQRLGRHAAATSERSVQA